MTEPHYHVWIRAGRIFTMSPKEHRTQQAAAKAAVKLRPDPADRMVRRCAGCPPTVSSKRRGDHRSKREAVIVSVAAEFRLPLASVRRAMSRGEDEARRERWCRAVSPGGSAC